MNSTRQRRRYLVHLRYQLPQAGAALAANLLVMLFMAVLMSWLYLLFYQGNLVGSHNRLFPLYLAGAALVVMLLSTLWSLRRSRAVAGMMGKIFLLLTDASRGVFPRQPLVFRQSDHFRDLAQPLNACFVRMKRQQASQEETLEVLQGLQEALQRDELNQEIIDATLAEAIELLQRE
ncbi:hypothetical protein [Desulfobulbus alkaliphilus]|uniref:hypothetical protein n=1 Tax=Desulfobulbus alkaliphilus TaxID=869814 RepID=UPI0019625C40|nr:hypothetical protein [Desulfobulbus alkaliphilus]MBM9536585.1 hypothetical protein [Desulfobulbus alkaliphilus]